MSPSSREYDLVVLGATGFVESNFVLLKIAHLQVAIPGNILLSISLQIYPQI